MKTRILTLLSLLLYLPLQHLTAQNTPPTSRYSLQLDFGRAKTFHYNAPVFLILFYEGSIVEKQFARTAPDYLLSVAYDVDTKNSIKIGYGFSQYRFYEKGLSDVGDGSAFYPYEILWTFKYFQSVLGYRHLLSTAGPISPFLQSEIIGEYLFKKYYTVNKLGVAVKFGVGTLLRLSKHWSADLNAFYKTGITRYNPLPYPKYIPYSYGLQAGLNYRF